MKIIDARGLKCPEPVIITKKALEEIEEGNITSIVDNTIAKENLVRLASGMGLEYIIDEVDGNYHVIVKKVKKAGEKEQEPRESGYIIFITSDKIGIEDNELGGALMKSYIYALSEVSPLPDAMIFLNSGVRLTTEGSGVLDSIRKLEKASVKIINCGTCLDFYDLKDKVEAGIVSNMYSIVEIMNRAPKVISVG